MKDEVPEGPLYPLAEHAAERLRSRTGVAFDGITLEAVRSGAIDSDDLTVDRQTLLLQAIVAEDAGYRQLAENLRRAAELVEIPNERLLQIYEALRPRRASYAELIALAEDLETRYTATVTGRFLRQAAGAYRVGGMLREDAAH
jgi:propanediol dehydratase small subunit